MADEMDRPRSLWILTDGKPGDEQPLIGIAEAIGLPYALKHVHPRPPHLWLMPWGPVPPRDRPWQAQSLLAPPFPEICLAAGRRAVAYLRALKQASPKTLTVFFRDPRTSRHGADLLITQSHDQVLGAHVLQTLTGPHRMSAPRLAEARRRTPSPIAGLPDPRVAVLVGGNGRHHRFTAENIAEFVERTGALQAQGAGLMITTSRRTPPALRAALGARALEGRVLFHAGEGENLLLAFLAHADHIVVTADSTNMVSEAAATGKPIHLFHPSGGHPKFETFFRNLAEEATIRSLDGTLPQGGTYAPIDATPLIADRILKCWRKLNRGEGRARP